MTDIDAAKTETAGSDASTPDFEDVFSPSDPVEVLWVKAYQGEVLGEALFGQMAEKIDDEEHASKMRMLAKLERRTKEAIVPALERAGLSTEPAPESLRMAAEQSIGATLPWKDLLALFEPITTKFCAMYVRIGELDPSEKETSELLVAHELALRNFARAEIADDTETSLDQINALAHMH
jgi:hypothetical protein